MERPRWWCSPTAMVGFPYLMLSVLELLFCRLFSTSSVDTTCPLIIGTLALQVPLSLRNLTEIKPLNRHVLIFAITPRVVDSTWMGLGPSFS